MIEDKIRYTGLPLDVCWEEYERVIPFMDVSTPPTDETKTEAENENGEA